MALVSSSLRSICEHLGITISSLADLSGIHRTALSRIQNGHDEMTRKMLEKLLALTEINDEDAATLAEDWTLDEWPKRAKDLLVIHRRKSYYGDNFVIQEPAAKTQRDDELGRVISDLSQKARSNPALARALANLNRSLEGRTDVVD